MKLLKWLSVSDRLAKKELDLRLAPLGINSSQHMYLLKVCDQPGILQESFINSFYVHPSNIVRMIATLEKNGFLIRKPWEKDKRTWCLYPTQRALDIAGQIRTACQETETALTAGLSAEERELLAGMLFRTGKQLARQLNIERMEDEFDE